MAGIANQDAVMLPTHEPAGGSDSVDVLQGKKKSGCEVVGEVADDALCLVQLDGMSTNCIITPGVS